MVDLFCGRGGWTRAALARGWRCIGYDLFNLGYPAELRQVRLPVPLSELLALRPAAVLASPPCEDYARYHLPWINSRKPPDEALLRWAVGLIGSFPTVVVECSRFAGWHVPGGRLIRPYHLWGDVPALMPHQLGTKDGRRGTTSLPRAERTARAAEIPPELADWILAFAERRYLAGGGR